MDNMPLTRQELDALHRKTDRMSRSLDRTFRLQAFLRRPGGRIVWMLIVTPPISLAVYAALSALNK
jgi:hypothetical protein